MKAAAEVVPGSDSVALPPSELLDELGITASEIARRGLPLCPEAADLEVAEIGGDGRQHMLVPAAARAWRRLKEAAARAGVELQIVSAFRTVERQAEIIRRKLASGQPIRDVLSVSAPPGYSEHHTGRAIDVGTLGSPALDVGFDRTAAFAWLAANAKRFGFTLSFPQGNSYGYRYEPWHWCYAADSTASRTAAAKALLTDRRILLAVTWLIEFSLFLSVFTVSRWLAEAGADLLEMGVVGGLFSLAGGAASIVGGRVADRVGHHRVMLAGLALALVGEAALLGSARGSTPYFLGYFLVGGAIGSVYPPIVAELTRGGDPVARRSGVGRTIILFCVAWNLGLIASQLIGGALFDTGPTSPLLAAALATLVAAGSTIYLAMRPPRREPAVPITAAHDEHRALSASFVPLAWLANLAGTFAMSMIFHLFPKLMVTTGVDPELHGLLLAFSRGVIIVTYGVLYRSAFWHHSFATMATAQLLAVAGLVVIALAPSPGWWAVGLALLAQLVGVNYFSSLYYSTTGSHDENRAAASGMHEATLAFGIALGSILGGWTGLHWGDRSPYLLAAAALLVMLGVQALWYGSRVRTRASGPLVEAKRGGGTMTTTEDR